MTRAQAIELLRGSGSMGMLLMSVALGGCSSADPGPPVPITFATGVCEGTCPEWQARVTETGGVFRGGRFSRVAGERAFALTAAQYRAIAATLAPVRPKGKRDLFAGQPGCEHAATDMRTIHVQWGDRDSLAFYTGCDGAENARINDALMEAERLLPASRLAGG
jgi:hypothetical protein